MRFRPRSRRVAGPRSLLPDRRRRPLVRRSWSRSATYATRSRWPVAGVRLTTAKSNRRRSEPSRDRSRGLGRLVYRPRRRRSGGAYMTAPVRHARRPRPCDPTLPRAHRTYAAIADPARRDHPRARAGALKDLRCAPRTTSRQLARRRVVASAARTPGTMLAEADRRRQRDNDEVGDEYPIWRVR
jgi:hypothetical protein